MDDRDTALWWAKIRSGGPQRVPPGGATPAGLSRLVEADARAVWLLPDLPESAGPAVLEEYGLPSQPVVDPKNTMRVLAACLRCCWANPGAEIWPGLPASFEQVAVVFAHLTPGRRTRDRRRVLLAGIRRLDRAGWLRYDESAKTVRLGVRVVSYGSLELSTLRELWRMVPTDDGEADPSGEGGRE